MHRQHTCSTDRTLKHAGTYQAEQQQMCTGGGQGQGMGRGQPRQYRGDDKRYDLTMDFTEAVFGCLYVPLAQQLLLLLLLLMPRVAVHAAAVHCQRPAEKQCWRCAE